MRRKFSTADNKYRYNFDYFVKDHLGNTRMVLTDEQKQDIYPAATLEGDINDSKSALYVEKGYYNIDATKVMANPAKVTLYPNNNGIPNSNPNGDQNANSQKMYLLKGTDIDNQTGLNIVLKVVAGYRVDIFGKSFWSSGTAISPSNSSIFVDGLTNLLTAFTNAPMVTNATHGTLTPAGLGTSPNLGLLNDFGSNQGTTAGQPKAFFNYLFFDDQFNFIPDKSSSIPVGAADAVYSLPPTEVDIPKNGYLYVYCSNESPMPVYFDNLQVVHTRGPVGRGEALLPDGAVDAGHQQRCGWAAARPTRLPGQGKARGRVQRRQRAGGVRLQCEVL